ncbi:MAG: peptidylprolyl isomerase [Vicinamibacterales bacterium]|nr:peptidylprolyl isomerase [Vicinamibacterales bacterium]
MIIARHPRTALLPALVLLVAATACRPAPQAPPPVSPDTWAVVDGRNITREDVERAYRRTAQATVSDEEALYAKLVLLDELILRDLMVAKAAALKIELPDTELDAAYLEARKDVPDDRFQEELKRRNLTVGDMREALRRDLLAQKVLEREVVSRAAASDQDVSAFFEANRASFNVPEDSWHLAQIVVTPVREAQVANRSRNDATTPQEAAQKVQLLMERLKAGSAFRELAADFSEDAESAVRGGDLGLVPISALRQAPAPLRDAVLAVEPGTVRLVTVGGVHTIVLVVAKEPAGQRELTSPGVKERITELLRGRREQTLRAAYLAALRTDATVVNHLARRVVEAGGKVPGGAAPAAGTAQ